MFLGNDEKVYIMDKAEGNAAQVAGHPAWASVWDIATRKAEVMDVPSNIFCSSGLHLPNGSYATFGGNQAVGRGGNRGSQLGNGGFTAIWDAEYQDFDGSRAIRILNPCKNSDNFAAPECQWFDDATLLAMKAPRWYSTAEALADGTIVMMGGFTSGGYINRNYPNIEPNGGGSQNTYEFHPARPEDPPILPFLTRTSGLNSYVHAFLMPSGNMFLQANYSTTLWNYDTNTETPLPDMPGQIVRVYPASGAVAMLPLTPANGYSPTILFCGGSDMPDEAWGDFAYPRIDTWDYPASTDCHQIEPEPADGSAPVYVKTDDMLDPRTMGQFIILPDGKLLVVNGAVNGTAGYAQRTYTIETWGDMPYGESLANGPVFTPAIYDPNAPAGSRWSNAGLEASTIPRMYHSSAMLLPDGSVIIAGSNPNVDVNTTAQVTYPTEYRAEIFYPPYFGASTRPQPSGVPTELTYGGESFDITIPPSSYSGSANDAAENTVVAVTRGGFTTHAMNMGQRYLQLNNTYTVKADGTIVLHCSQMPPVPEIFQPGPGLLFVTIKGIPSNGTFVRVGSGRVEVQPRLPVAALPVSVRLDSAKGSADAGSTSVGGTKNGQKDGGEKSEGGTSMGVIIGAAVGGVVVIAIIGAIIGVCLARRRRAAARAAGGATGASALGGGSGGSGYPMAAVAGVGGASAGMYAAGRESDSSAFVPLKAGTGHGWNASTSSVDRPYRDDGAGSARGSYDPYGASGGYQQQQQNRGY